MKHKNYKEIKEFTSPILPLQRVRLKRFLESCETDTLNQFLHTLWQMEQGGNLTRGEIEFFTRGEWDLIKTEFSYKISPNLRVYPQEQGKVLKKIKN